jgi:hypothetical protein
MEMVSMKIAPEEKKEMIPTAIVDAPDYPYGLCLQLGDDTFKKLGIEKLEAGQTLMLNARVEVRQVMDTIDKMHGKHWNAELQITDMALSTQRNEVAADKLYNQQ